LPFVREHASLQRLEHVHALGGLRGRGIGIGKLEEPLCTCVFLTQQLLENLARPVEISAANQRVAKCLEKNGVALRAGKRLEKRGRLCRSVAAQFCLCVEERNAALLRRELVGPAQQLQRIDLRAACRRELPRSKKRARGQRVLTDLLRRLRQPHLPAEILRIELRDALPAKKARLPGVPRS